MAAMNVHIPRWNHDVFAWNFSRAEGVANDVDGHSSGYLVLQYMATFNNTL